MPFISPMLASPMPKQPIDLSSGEYAAEEKFDGHRLIVEVSSGQAVDLFAEGPLVQAWGRYGIARILPSHITDALAKFPYGIYDGELLAPGKRSYGVTELVNSSDLVFTAFDLLKLFDEDTTDLTYDERRALLEKIFSTEALQSPATVLATSRVLYTEEQMRALRNQIWARDGEGLIIKRRRGKYHPGKRTKEFIKIKQLQTAVLTVIGFEASKGTIQDRGRFATVVLRDDGGYQTKVKTLNNVELDRFEKEAGPSPHPAIGRRLCIEYQERTPDGSYRHPRWDRWEDE